MITLFPPGAFLLWIRFNITREAKIIRISVLILVRGTMRDPTVDHMSLQAVKLEEDGLIYCCNLLL